MSANHCLVTDGHEPDRERLQVEGLLCFQGLQNQGFAMQWGS